MELPVCSLNCCRDLVMMDGLFEFRVSKGCTEVLGNMDVFGLCWSPIWLWN